jgi:histidinol-phosphate aminotransferase
VSAGSYNSGLDQGPDAIRLHLNEIPYGAPAGATAAAAAELERAHRYPDGDRTALRERVAAHLGVSPDMVLAANGTDELVHVAALSYAAPGSRVLLSDGTFPGFRSAAVTARAEVVCVPLAAGGVDVQRLAQSLDGVRLAFLCNPHNPLGSLVPPGQVADLARSAERAGAVLVVDEAYVDFAGPEASAVGLVRDGCRLIVTRTFSKAYGLAALRCGYAVGPADLVEAMRRVHLVLPFAVNRPAQAAAAAALDAAGHIARVRELTDRARARLSDRLDELGLAHRPSVANFVMVRVPTDSGRLAAGLAGRRRVLVRDLGPFGFPGHLRVTAGTIEEVDGFARALSAELLEPSMRGGG